MGYDLRRIKQREDAVFNRTAQTMALFVRTTDPTPPGYSDDLFQADTEPSEGTGDLVKYFFRGKFEETAHEQYQAGGYVRSIKAVITVPMMYRQLLEQAAYIDPYLDGSRFRKSGNVIVESRLYIIQNIDSVSLASLKEVGV